MRRWRVILAGVLALAGVGVGSEITASLEVVAGQDVGAGPYRLAKLTLANSASAAVEAVTLRATDCGPTVRYRFTVPPGGEGELEVALPAASPVQEYVVAALDAGGAELARARGAIVWPAELVTTADFIDDAFGAWADDFARWEGMHRRNLLLLGALFVTAAAGALLVRNRWARAAAALLAAGATVGLIAWVFMPAAEPVVQVLDYELILHDGTGGVEMDSFAVVSSRRTREWMTAAGTIPHAVYAARAAAMDDDATVRPAERSIRLTLRPGQVRVIRPAPDARALRRGLTLTARTDVPVRTGSAAMNGENIEIRFVGAPRGLLLVCRDDSVWTVGESPFGTLGGIGGRVSISKADAVAYPVFLGSGRGAVLNTHASRLLDYWRDRHRQGGKVYLLEVRAREAGARIEVIELQEGGAATSRAATTSQAATIP